MSTCSAERTMYRTRWLAFSSAPIACLLRPGLPDYPVAISTRPTSRVAPDAGSGAETRLGDVAREWRGCVFRSARRGRLLWTPARIRFAGLLGPLVSAARFNWIAYSPNGSAL